MGWGKELCFVRWLVTNGGQGIHSEHIQWILRRVWGMSISYRKEGRILQCFIDVQRKGRFRSGRGVGKIWGWERRQDEPSWRGQAAMELFGEEGKRWKCLRV
jgi:hypothetical protein